jgi:drug/metabolite transporter (DMT)-like permease
MLVWLVILGGIATLGHLALTRAFHLADASAMMPFDYTKLPFAALLGYLAFGETMDLWSWVGAGIIAGSTIYIAQREAMQARRARSALAASATAGSPAE